MLIIVFQNLDKQYKIKPNDKADEINKNKRKNKSKTPNTTYVTACPTVESKIKLIVKMQSLESNNLNFCNFSCFVSFSK